MMAKCQRCEKDTPRLFAIRFRGSLWQSMFYDVCKDCYLEYSAVVEKWIKGEKDVDSEE